MADASFQIERVLGAGGHGTVYRALMRSPHGLERAVALKMLHADRATDGDVARLRDEAKLLARVKHRAVIGVLDLVKLDAGWAVVMELADGLDLTTVLSYTAVPPRAAVQIVGEVASALHAMWTAEEDGRPLRLVHRDLKPANLVVTPNGEVKILDFGLATSRFVAREAHTATDMVVGTLRYMAPERFQGVVDGPGDMYSLGVLLLDLLRVELGVSGFCTPEELERRVAPALAAADRVAGPEVAALIAQLLAHDPLVRPTALELAKSCRRLAPRLPGPDFADWALEDLQALIDELTERLGEDPLVGATVTTEMPRPPARVPWELALGGLVFAGVLALGMFVAGGLMGGGAFWLGTAQPRRAALIAVNPVAGLPEGAMPRSLTDDGRFVAYALDGQLFKQELGGDRQKVPVPHGDVRSATISPDGARIAYRAGREVHVLDGLGAPRPLLARGYLEAWHADGERLLAIVPEADGLAGALGALVVVSASDGSATTLPGGSRFWGGRWEGASDAVIAASPDGLFRLTDDRAERLGAPLDVWTVSRDGRTLVAADFDGVRSRLLSGRLGGELAVDTTFEAMIQHLGPPAGDRFLLGQRRVEARVRLVELDAARQPASERLLPLPRELANAVLLPEGDRISLAVPRPDVQPGGPRSAGQEKLSVVDLEGRTVDALGALTTRGAMDAGFAADGRSTWIEMPGQGVSHEVLAVPLDRNEAARVVARFDPAEVASLQVHPAGDRVAVTDAEGRVHVVPLADRLVLDGPVGLQGWRVRAWTRDDRLFLTDASDRLAIAAPDGSPVPLLDDVHSVWPAGPEHALLERTGAVWALHVPSGRSWRIAELGPDVSGVNASASADLSRVIVVEWRDHVETWMAEYR